MNVISSDNSSYALEHGVGFALGRVVHIWVI